MKINETQKITVQFIVTSFNSPIVLQGLKKTFNFVSRFIQIFIIVPKIFHIEFWRDTNGRIFCCQRFNNFISRISSVRQYIFKVDTQNLFLEKQSLRLPTDKLILIGLPFLLPNPYTVHATECMWQRCCQCWFHSATLPQKKFFQNSDQHNWWTAFHLPKLPAGFATPVFIIQ